MSKISEFVAAQNVKLDAANASIAQGVQISGAISLKLDEFKVLLELARSGELSAEDQALLDDFAARISAVETGSAGLAADLGAVAAKADTIEFKSRHD